MHCAAFEVESGSVTSFLSVLVLSPSVSFLLLPLFSPSPSLYFSVFVSVAFPTRGLPVKAAEIWFTYVIRVTVHGFPNVWRVSARKIGPSILGPRFAVFSIAKKSQSISLYEDSFARTSFLSPIFSPFLSLFSAFFPSAFVCPFSSSSR